MFLPKLISVTLWNIVYLQAFYGLNNLKNIQPAFLFRYLGLIIPFSIISTYIFALYVNLSQQYSEDKSINLKNSLRKSLGRIIPLLIILLLIAIITSLIVSPLMLIGIYGFITQNGLLMILGASLSAIALIGCSVIFYFAPTGVALKDKSIFNSINQSLKFSRSHTTGIIAINLISGGLLLLGFISSGNLKSFGVLGFLFGRYLSGIVSTYVTIVNPYFYLDLQSK